MIRVLLVTKGHPFDREAFFAVFDADEGIEWTHVEQPAAQVVLHPDRLDAWDMVLCYDMPGIRFTRTDPPAAFAEPPGSFVAGLRGALEAGKGFVFLHHAVAGWPAWEEYASIVGGRFHYQPATLAGVAYPSSGYRHNVTHEVEVLDPAHPLCAGLPATFTLTDELYCFPVLEDRVVPLLRTRHDMDASGFYSADLAIRGQRDSNAGWSHPRGSQLVGWVKHAGRSPVGYLQFGDGPGTYADPVFAQVLGNAIRWAASAEAHAWARNRRDETGCWS